MKEYIEREALTRLLIDKYNFFPVFVKNAIEEAPTADVVEVKHGEWMGDRYVWRCSVCHKWLEVLQGTAEMNYCPNCGAEMDRKEDNQCQDTN